MNSRDTATRDFIRHQLEALEKKKPRTPEEFEENEARIRELLEELRRVAP